MDPIEEALTAKLSQAGFFLQKIEQSPDNVFEAGCYLAAFISIVRSIALYVRSWLEDQGKIKKKSDKAWVAKIKPWEATLRPDIRDRWECITRLRNKDIHEAPIIPAHRKALGMFAANMFASNTFAAGIFGGQRRMRVVDPKTQQWREVVDCCKGALEAAELLTNQYKTL